MQDHHNKNLDNETWKPLYNLPKYEISNKGRVRKTEIRKQSVNSVGYNALHLSHNNKARNIAVHRAVWETFRDRIPPDKMINHKNGIKTDNRIENLELVTNRENIEHYKNNLLTYKGEKVNTAKLTEDDVRNIRERYNNGVGIMYLAKEYKVGRHAIQRVVKRKTWRHVE